MDERIPSLPAPVRHYIVDETGDEIEISAEELMELLKLKRSGVTGIELLVWLENRRAVEQ